MHTQKLWLSIFVACAIVMAWVVTTGCVHAQSGPILSLKPWAQIGGASNALAQDGDYLYLGSGPRLVVMDVTDPLSPARIAQSDPLPDIIQSIAVSGRYAYVSAGYAGIFVFDVANPFQPSLVASRDTPGWANRLTVSGSYIYLADGWAGLQIVDAMDPTSPEIVGSFDTSVDNATSVAISGHFAYVTDGGKGLWVVDVTVPSAPKQYGSVHPLTNAEEVALSGGYAYIITQGTGLQILDIANPAAPHLVSTLSLSGWMHDIAIAGGLTYVVGDRLYVVNAADRTLPQLVHSADMGGSAIVLSAGFAYVTGQGLRVLDMTDPSLLGSVKYVDMLKSARGIATTSQLSVIMDASEVKVLDFDDGTAPSVSQSLRIAGLGDVIAASGTRAFVARQSQSLNELCVIDMSDAAAPALAGCVALPVQPTALSAAGDYVYALGGTSESGGTLCIVHAATPDQPHIEGMTTWSAGPSALAVSGNYAYVTDSSWPSRLRIIDVSNPMTPSVCGAVALSASAQAIAVAGRYAYVAGYNLDVLDISDPLHPLGVGSLPMPSWVDSVAVDVHGTLACVAVEQSWSISDPVNGIYLFDVSNPSNPKAVQLLRLPGLVRGMAAAGESTYLAADSGGVYAFDFSVPSPPTLLEPADQAVLHYNNPALKWQPSVSSDVAGYVLDFNGVITDVGHVESWPVRPLSQGTFTWTVAAYDAASNRSSFANVWRFTTQPVSITLQNGRQAYSGNVDTWIDLSNPNQNNDSGTAAIFLRLYTSGQQKALLQFDLENIESGSLIYQALLHLYVGSRTNANPLAVDIYRLIRPWHSSEATWNQAMIASPWDIPGATGSQDRDTTISGTLHLTQAPGTWAKADVTTLTQAWLDDPESNFGCVLEGKPGGGVQYALRSSDHPEPTDRPKLVVVYWPPTSTPTPTGTPAHTRTPTATPTPTTTRTGSPTPTPSATRTQAAPMPDLIISGAIAAMRGYSGGCVLPGVPMVLKVCVANEGNGAAGAFSVLAGGCLSPMEGLRVAGLAAGGSACVESEGAPAWWTECQIVADAYGEVVESDEMNNAWAGLVPIPTAPPLCTTTPRGWLPLVLK